MSFKLPKVIQFRPFPLNNKQKKLYFLRIKILQFPFPHLILKLCIFSWIHKSNSLVSIYFHYSPFVVCWLVWIISSFTFMHFHLTIFLFLIIFHGKLYAFSSFHVQSGILFKSHLFLSIGSCFVFCFDKRITIEKTMIPFNSVCYVVTYFC